MGNLGVKLYTLRLTPMKWEEISLGRRGMGKCGFSARAHGEREFRDAGELAGKEGSAQPGQDLEFQEILACTRDVQVPVIDQVHQAEGCQEQDKISSSKKNKTSHFQSKPVFSQYFLTVLNSKPCPFKAAISLSSRGTAGGPRFLSLIFVLSQSRTMYSKMPLTLL
jgi:hypothetical protein